LKKVTTSAGGALRDLMADLMEDKVLNRLLGDKNVLKICETVR